MFRRTLTILTASFITGTALAQTTPTAPTPPTRQREPAKRPAERPQDTGRTPAKQATPAAQGQTIVATAAAAGNCAKLTELLAAAGLVDALQGPGPFTLFAPTDEAFAKLPKELLADLAKPENKARLQSILKYHIVPARTLAADASTKRFAQTMQGQRVDLTASGRQFKVDNATVTTADIACSNGVIHVVDAVILPTEGSMLDVARGTGTLATLLAAIDAAGMTELFRGPGPYTLLAPSDAAFRALPKGMLEDLLKPENKSKLAEVLAFHVVPGNAAYSDTIAQMTEVRTIGGMPVQVTSREGALTLNGATVVKADIESGNGVIQVIDAVLLPKSMAPKSTAGAGSEKPEIR